MRTRNAKGHYAKEGSRMLTTNSNPTTTVGHATVAKYVGIDPGLDGGVAMITLAPEVWRTPVIKTGGKRAYDVPAMIELLRPMVGCIKIACIEQAHAFPQIGAGTNFAVGHGYGLWLGILATLKIPHMTVSANAWTKRMHAGVNAKDSKAKSLIVAQRLWPEVNFVPEGCRKPHDGLIDAALIAEYGRRENR